MGYLCGENSRGVEKGFMKVLLISHPNAYHQKPDFPPIGIAYLGAVIKKRGDDAQLIDGGRTSLKVL